MSNKLLYLFIFIAISFHSSSIHAQPGFGRGGSGLLKAPLGLQYDYFGPSQINQLMLTVSNPLPAGKMAPRDTLKMQRRIRISFLNAGGGVRFGGVLDSSEFRWRVKLLEGAFRKWLFSFGATLVDLDKSGLMEKDYRWVNARFGLQPFIRIGKVMISPHITGFAGTGEWNFGDIHYASLGTIADSTFAGPEFGYRAGIMVNLLRRFMLIAEYRDRTLSYGPDPHFKTWGIELRLLPGKGLLRRLRPFFRYEYQNAELNDSGISEENGHIQVGITLPMNRGR